ncbi:ATP-binding protein [Paenibacillus sp. P26]|nr:ATP-binding protein [Paenibacillus sp. P26]
MRSQVQKAYDMQLSRYKGTGITFNSELSGKSLRTHVRLDQETSDLLQQSFDHFGLSVRAHDRILKISRTIADLEQSEDVRKDHIAEALQYRILDKKNILPAPKS